MNKYHNIPTTLDNHTFPSKREAARYLELKLLLIAKHIHSLRLQPAYPIVVNNLHVATYYADFTYVDAATGSTVIEDAKGVRTSVYALKKKLVEALYQVQIVEV